MDLSACDLSYQWQAPLIDKQMVFAAELAAISWVSGSVVATSRCWHASSVDTDSVSHDLSYVKRGPPVILESLYHYPHRQNALAKVLEGRVSAR